MPYKEREIRKVYYTISETCNEINCRVKADVEDAVAPSTLRFWETKCPKLKPTKLIGKRKERRYTPEDIDRITMFTKIIFTGWYTLKGAVHMFNIMKQIQ